MDQSLRDISKLQRVTQTGTFAGRLVALASFREAPHSDDPFLVHSSSHPSSTRIPHASLHDHLFPPIRGIPVWPYVFVSCLERSKVSVHLLTFKKRPHLSPPCFQSPPPPNLLPQSASIQRFSFVSNGVEMATGAKTLTSPRTRKRTRMATTFGKKLS